VRVLQLLDAAALRAWCATGLEGLTAAREEIDDLNVYPVPDGDTGTNLQLTMVSVVEALAHAPSDLASTVEAIVTGSLLGARGNSGVILSQLLRGLGEVLARLEAATATDLCAALLHSAASGYTAVAVPVEGTLLTVAREAAEAATGAVRAAVGRSARRAAEASLARTPDLLPQLAAAGVVDAGGRGWCVLLEALEQVVTGSVVRREPRLVVPRDRSGLSVAREAGSDAYAYEVQFLLREGTGASVDQLKQTLGLLGDSLVVVGADGLHNVHVHVNDVGAAVEAGVVAGRPFRITVTRFEDQVRAEGPGRGRAVLAVAPGAGLAALFREAGAHVVAGGPSASPSTAELLAGIRATGAAEVVLLPNDGNVCPVAVVAGERARADGVAVAVVPTRSVLQGLAAASVADPSRRFEDDVATMAAAAGGTRWAEVTRAVRAAPTTAGACAAGDVLGLLEGRVALVGQDVVDVAKALLGRLLDGGGELVTVVVGAQAEPDASARLASYLEAEHPGLEVLVLYGGQPHYPLLVGVE
jgi:DAK2 domain fusion protein YloV